MLTLKESISRIKSLILLTETFNYHFTGGKNGDKPLDITKKHVSDTLNGMSGRDTGHFGSGTYFSTYKRDNPKVDDEYGRYSDFRNQDGNLILIKKGLYRINIDFYKNLYHITTTKQGEGLFKTLRECNKIFYGYESYKSNGEKPNWGSISTAYLQLRINFKNLGLSLPDYRNFIKMMDEAVKDNDYRNKDIDKSNASFSTRMMELNGYNGVNASNIPQYDNTTHGSVIYDLSKIESDMEKITLPSNHDWNLKLNKDTHVYGDRNDIEANMLNGNPLISNDDIYHFRNLPENMQVIYMKRYYHYIYKETLDQFLPSVQNAYKKTLPTKIKNNTIHGEMKQSDVEILIDDNQFELINDKLLPTVFRFYRLGSQYKNKLIPHMRELNEYEKEDFEFWKEY